MRELTLREKEVVDLLLKGYEYKEIAKELHITRRTVKAHLCHLYTLYGIENGIKRVKLAVIMYRKQQEEERKAKAASARRY